MSGPSFRRWAPWTVMGVVLGIALVVGARHPSPALGPSQRAAAIDAQLRCPSCEDLSVAQSSAPTAVGIRQIVAQRVAQGESDAVIEAYLVSRYGEDILLRPPASGGTGVVWVAPIVVVALCLVGLGLFFWRRRRVQGAEVSDDDRELVAAALAERGTS